MSNAHHGDQSSLVNELNSLLRGAISATETYKQAIDKVKDHGEHAAWATKLREIQADHGRAAQQLREHIVHHGGEAADTSGAWGTFAKAIEGVSSLFGDTAAIKALKEGEEHGLKDYEDALKHDRLDADCVALVRDELLPQQRRHLQSLDGILAAL